MIRKFPKVSRSGRVGRRTRVGVVELDAVTGGGIRKLDLMPEGMRAWARAVGMERARAVWRLRGRGVVGTLPELCAYHWLESRKTRFEFQSAQMGGRTIAGGAVVDFVIFGLSANGIYIWRVQGEYWHKGVDVEQKDFVQAARLMRLKIGGVPVVAVVDLWEGDIYERFPLVFKQAEFGVGLRN